MTLRKYMILDTREKALVVDEQMLPLRFVDLDEAKARATVLRGRKSAEAYAVVDDLGNKWLWSKTGVLRVALSMDAKSLLEEAIEPLENPLIEGWSLNVRCTAAGNVESFVLERFPDGPPIEKKDSFGRSYITTERWAEKHHWKSRGPMAPLLANVATRVHKLEARALTAKHRAERAVVKKRQESAARASGEELTCQVCGRWICSGDGLIALHGYRRPGTGWQTASCMGARHAPFEESNSALIGAIEHSKGMIERLSQEVATVGAETSPVVVYIKPHWGARNQRPARFEFTRDTYVAVAAASEKRLSSERVSFKSHKDSYVYHLQGQIREWRTDLLEFERRNAGWRRTMEFVGGKWRSCVADEVAA